MPDIYYDVDAALAAVPINKFPIMDVDGLAVDAGMVYNEAGLSLEWNFITNVGAFTHTAVTPTDTGGDYDFINQGEGMYTIEIPDTGGGTINNDAVGFGWFSGNSTADLPWISPIFGFRATALNDPNVVIPPTAAEIVLEQLVESYAAAGVAPTVAQALMQIQQMLHDWKTVGTTITVRKLDGTDAMTFTIDNASNPTDIERTT
jgi:hypothetical protein